MLCPCLAKEITIYVTFGLGHLSKYLTCPHGTDVQSLYSDPDAYILQGLTRTFFKKGGGFCTIYGQCSNVKTQWMWQKFNLKSNDSCHVGLLSVFSQMCTKINVWNSGNLLLFVDIWGFSSKLPAPHGTYYKCIPGLWSLDKVRWRPGHCQR